jgi:hypothetical protein
MKKKITGLALLVLLMGTTTFATNIEDNVNGKIFTEFNRKFGEAKEVSWSKTDKYVKASFKLGEQVMFAYFNESGDLLGVARNMLSSHLPIYLLSQLKKNCADGWITELFEFARPDQTDYFVTIENSEQKIFLKSEGSGSWEAYKKIKKT